MLFNSYIFVLLFLPLTFAGYFLLNRWSFGAGKTWLLLMSLWFYGYLNPWYLLLIATSIAFNYYMAKLFARKGLSASGKNALLAAAVTANLAVLFYYKYLDFFIENINSVFNVSFPLRHLILPLAISFFTFKQIAYLVDSYKGEAPSYTLLDYSLFVSFFPQLIVGPILLHGELIPQLLDAAKKKMNFENIAAGLMAFALGLGKKVLLADTFARAVDVGFDDIGSLNATSALLVMLFLAFQIYFDFSGYCDMATGLGLMFNIDIAMNFNSPYKATRLTDFWKRWHMTLTRFFRLYVYIPLGGNRRGKPRSYVNILIVFLLSGFWHGANFTFIIWGALHGLFYVFDRVFDKGIGRLPSALNWAFTFLFVNLTWIVFRAPSLSDALRFYQRILAFEFTRISDAVSAVFYTPEAIFVNRLMPFSIFGDYRLYLVIVTAFSLLLVLFAKNTNERIVAFSPKSSTMVMTAALLIWSILSFADVSTFMYMGF